jgi:hypothetical protein
MAENKYFLDLAGLQSLWNKMKSTFASKGDVEAIESQIGTINENIANLEKDIADVEALTLLNAPKEAINYSDAISKVNADPKTVSAGSIIVVGSDEELDGVTYKEGFYIVDTDRSLHYIGTTVGGTDADIADLRSKISKLEEQIINAALIVDQDGNTLGSLTISNNSLLMVYDDQVVANSDSVNALTHKAIAAKFGELEGMISGLPKFNILPVDQLPEDEISLSTIYLLKNTDEQDKNLYTEYIYVQQNKKWEKLGEQSIALDNYVTIEYLTNTINDALKNYATTAQLEQAKAEVKEEILGEVAATYATQESLADFMTEEMIISSIQTGRIGDVITITDEQIDELV